MVEQNWQYQTVLFKRFGMPFMFALATRFTIAMLQQNTQPTDWAALPVFGRRRLWWSPSIMGNLSCPVASRCDLSF